MTPIPIADPPRVPALRPEPDAKTTDDRADREEGLPDAFLVAMGLVPGPAAPQSTSPDTEDGGGTSPARTDSAAPALASPPSMQPAGACGGLAAAETAPGSSAPDTPDPASATTVSVGEMAFRASSLASDTPGAGADAGPGGGPAEGIAGAADPAMSGDGDTATGGDGQTADSGAQAPGPAPRLRARASGADSVPVTADQAGEDPAAQPPKGAAPAASAADTAAAPAPASGGKSGSRVMTDSAGAADALAATPDAFADLAAGADPAAGTRLAERPHPVAHGATALPPGFGHRLAEAVAHFPDRGVELTLSPEELGRVRMMLSTHDGALTLSIQADRPETIDLMRRHIDQLAEDFRDLGFTDVSFSFGRDETASGGQRAERETNDPAAVSEADRPVRNASAPAGAPPGGLDLRL